MRHVDSKQIGKALPKDWAKVADEAYASIKDLAKDERAAGIEKSPRWQQLRDVLGDILDGKCWYCESRLKRSPTPIDHYRPKNNVKEAPNHGGYWWLAYQWDNYRFTCSHCNTYGTAKKRGVAGGKSDHFPLWDEARRATGPRSSMHVPDPLDAEQPLILDPLREADPGLLWFDPNGKVIPHPITCRNPKGYNYKRAIESIRILGLGQDELVSRRGKHCENILERLSEADDLLMKADAGDATAARQLDKRIRELKNAIDITAEYSAATKAALMAQRGTSSAVELVFLAG
jgi:uncharacterized protein (TIGR02646 family)